MLYTEADCLMLSALQHYAFCPRQCALIHKEQQWAENYLTTKGDLFHNRVDNYKTEKRKDFHTEFSMPIRSLRLGLSGRTDIVEIYYKKKEIQQVIPVEYKSGKVKSDRIDEVQLCAQAICLEEMMEITIPKGYLYYGKERRRVEIQLTPDLRAETEKRAMELHQMMIEEGLPNPILSPKCRSCSLHDICQPELLEKQSVRSYINRYLKQEEDD